jgi:AcrR family transcriptional regulator
VIHVSRRERARDATTAEIKATARRLLVQDGPDALTLRAIAREMGMTAPGLYRYFASHEDLVIGVCHDILAELTAFLVTARDTVAIDDPVGRLGATCRAFRRWALDHPREFELSFATGVAHQAAMAEAVEGTAGDPPVAAAPEVLSFGGVFLGIFVEIWTAAPFPVPDESSLPPDLVRQVRAFSAVVDDVLPLGALTAYIAGWVRLYGAVTIETFGLLRFALDDAEPLFEAMLADMARNLQPAQNG